MILINSIQKDYSTNDVMDWLRWYKQDVIRINEHSKISDLNINFRGDCLVVSFKVDGTICCLDKIKSYWFRRGVLDFTNFVPNSNTVSKDMKQSIYSHLINEELKTIEEFIVHILESKNKLGSYYNSNANKLKSLLIAKEFGLKTPIGLVSSLKSSLVKFNNEYQSLISKGIQDILSFVYDNKSYSYITELVQSEDIAEMNTSFFPSLLQENVQKRYELRSFYLKGEFYTMAIFSQEDEQTKVDFRDYNLEKPNRTVPYKLPFDIENKLDLFMKNMDLDTGSIDIIVTPELEYVFLEVNPVGQYGMTSIPCNYYLDEKIAKLLA